MSRFARLPGLRSFRLVQNRLRDALTCPKCHKSTHVFNAGETLTWRPERISPETHCTCPGGVCDTMASRSRHARFSMVHSDQHSVTIRDEGPWSFHPTVTNDPAWVVASMLSIIGKRRLFYIDTDDRLLELVIKHRRFDRIAPGPSDPQEILRLTRC